MIFSSFKFSRSPMLIASALLVFSLSPAVSFAQEAAAQPAPAATAPVRSLVAGRDYLVLAKPLAAPEDRLEVMYFFWYNSPATAKLDPLIRSWANTKASPFVRFRPLPAVLDNNWGYGARIFFALQLLNRESDISPKLIQAMDQGIVDYNSPKSLSDWMSEQGISRDSINKAVNDPRVIAQTSWMPSMMRRHGVERVPTVLIDGKFLFVQGEKETAANFMSKISFASDELAQRKIKEIAASRKPGKP